MHRLLVVRLSAFGDQVQCAPVVTDLRRRFPDARIDWAVDERFADVPRHHAHVDRVLAFPLKRLGKAGGLSDFRRALGALRAQRYDAVLDAHGVWKSAIVSRLARAGVIHGFAPEHCGEPPAARLYHRRHGVPRLDAAHRLRALAAVALGTDDRAPIDYGLRWDGQGIDDWSAGDGPYAVLAHSASRPEKEWPEDHWVAVGRVLADRGLRLLLPWGSPAEEARSRRLAAAIGSACIVPARQPVARWGATLCHAALLVGVDTGLTHLAVSAGAPVVALFSSTTASHFAPVHAGQRALGDRGRPATLDEVLAALPMTAGQSVRAAQR